MLLSTVLAVCASAWLFIAIANSVGADATRAFDEKILLSFREPTDLTQTVGPHWLGQFAGLVTHLGSAFAVVALAVLMIGYLGRRKEWIYVALVVVTVAGSYALNHALKSEYARERPAIVPHLAEVSSASFPSGHSQASSVIYLTLAALLSRHAARRRDKVAILSVALGLIGVVGLSRVFLGVHYPSDVLAGWSIGAAWALLWLMVLWQASRPRPLPL